MGIQKNKHEIGQRVFPTGGNGVVPPSPTSQTCIHSGGGGGGGGGGQRVFPTGGNGGKSLPHPHLEKSSPPSGLPPPQPKVNSPTTKTQFSSYNPIKTEFLTVSIAPAPFFFNLTLFGHTGHVNFYFN